MKNMQQESTKRRATLLYIVQTLFLPYLPTLHTKKKNQASDSQQRRLVTPFPTSRFSVHLNHLNLGT